MFLPAEILRQCSHDGHNCQYHVGLRLSVAENVPQSERFAHNRDLFSHSHVYCSCGLHSYDADGRDSIKINALIRFLEFPPADLVGMDVMEAGSISQVERREAINALPKKPAQHLNSARCTTGFFAHVHSEL